MSERQQTFYLTGKQQVILDLVMNHTEQGEFPDMDQLHEALPYDCTKQALQFSIRYLEQHGMVERRPREKRRGRSRRIIAPTPQCYAVMRPGSGV